MKILKTVKKDQVHLLMNFDYNNILGRLKYLLGEKALLFADVHFRKNEIVWSVKDSIDIQSFIDSNKTEVEDLKKAINEQLSIVISKIVDDSLIGNYAKQIITYPSDQYVFFTQIDGEYKIVLTGWGCKEVHSEDKIIDKAMYGLDETQLEKKRVRTSREKTLATDVIGDSTTQSKKTLRKVEGGFFIDNNSSKKRTLKKSKNGLLKSFILSFFAVIVALIIPMFLTGVVNRFVANLTSQWYLNGTSRILITLFITIATYCAAYIFIRLTALKKSIAFNLICFILTFMWAVCMGLLWMP